MRELFDRFDSEPLKGKDITIGELSRELLISDTGEVFYYRGINSLINLRYICGKHSFDDEVSKEIKGFYRLIEGCFILDDYVDMHYNGRSLYKKLKVGIKEPCPSSCEYAVIVNREDDEDLTRAVFGLTYGELETLLEAYAKTMGTCGIFYTYPKLTRSINNENFCDITEQWIPKAFPYIAFNDSGCDFSHVSLYGFYRHIQLLTGRKMNSLISRAILKSGIEENVLENVFHIGQNLFDKTKLTRCFLSQLEF